MRAANPILTRPDADGIDGDSTEMELDVSQDPVGVLHRVKGNGLYLYDNVVDVYRLSKFDG